MFVVPTIFSAIDKMSAPMKKMTGAVHDFATKAEGGIARAERVFNKLTPTLSSVGKQLLSFASAAVLTGAIIAGITFGVNALKDYESAVASFRTIVSDKTPAEFEKYKTAINDLANETGKSSVKVANSFEKIAGLNADFAKTPEAIQKVTKAVITLSEASGEELGPSAESLVGIMNQFNFAADQADRTINVLAAGTAVGASSIAQTAEAFTNFGAVAAGANITIEESVGLIQTMAQKSKFGSVAGDELKAAVINLQKANLGYVKGQFTINAALDQAAHKLGKLKTEQQKNDFLLKTFGKTGINTGQILLNNTKLFHEFTKGVTGTSAAETSAAINSATFAKSIERLKDKFINWITTNKDAGKALDLIKKGLKFVTDNLGTIINVITTTVKWFLIFKGAIIAAKVATTAYRVISNAFFLVDMIKYVASTQGLTFAQAAYTVALQSATPAQLSLNAAMAANPIGAVVLALGALALAVYAVYDAYKQLEAIAKKEAEHKKAIKDESFAVQDLEKKYLSLGKSKEEARKMAITDSKKSIIAGLAEVQTGLNSPDQAVKDKAMERLNVLSGKAEAVSNPSKAFEFAGNRFANSEDLKTKALSMGTVPGPTAAPFDWINEPMQKPAIDKKEAGRQASVNDIITQTNNAKVDINIKAPEGTTEASSNNDFVKIKTTSTMMTAK